MSGGGRVTAMAGRKANDRVGRFVHLGFGNWIDCTRIVAVVEHRHSFPLRQIALLAKEENRVVDITCGRRCRSLCLLDTGQVVRSAVTSDSVIERMQGLTPRESDAELDEEIIAEDEAKDEAMDPEFSGI